jgi:ferredoxin
MTYIVTTPCIDCKYTDCAAVCPVEAFHEMPDRLLINPDTCIDCDACLPECPVEAIYSDMSYPDEYAEWIAKNAEAGSYPIISTKEPALMGPKCSGPPEK